MRRDRTSRCERTRGARAAIATLLTLLGCLLVTAASAQARVYVSLTFDDGLDTQWEHRDVLDDLGVDGTYYVSSGKAGRAGYMSWDELRAMQDAGHEIGGHTRDHVNLPARTHAEQVAQACGDRDELLAEDLDARNFAYPYGAFNAGVKDVIRGCGYTSGRTTGGLDDPPDCCLYANAIPPRVPDPFQTRAWQIRLDTPLADYRSVIELARDDTVYYGGGSPYGGWLPLVFHDICGGTQCDDANEYAVDRELLGELIEWIKADPRLRIRTTAQVMAIPGDRTAPTVSLTAPADGAELEPGPVELTADASDAATAVDRVDFYADGALVGSDSEAPYAAEWDAEELGAVELEAWAYDDAGNVGRSLVHTVTVADLTPPMVELTAPADGATVQPGFVELTAEATDAIGVERVDFYAGDVFVGTDSEAPYAADWDAAVLGEVELYAMAYDEAGNEARSPVHTVTVADLTPPVVQLTAPADGAVVQPGQVTLSADASDAITGVERVEFLVGGVVVGTAFDAPYAVVWDAATATPGATVTIVARAYDEAGLEAESAPRSVTVARRTPPDPPDPPDPPEPPDPDPPTPPNPDPPRPPTPDPPVVQPPADGPGPIVDPPVARTPRRPSLRLRASVGAGRRLVTRLVVDAPAGIRRIELRVNGRLARHGTRISRRGDAWARLMRSQRVRPGRYAVVAVVVDRLGRRVRSGVARVVVRSAR